MKTYLVPTDFSNEARMAMRFAVDLATGSKGRVVLLAAYAIPVAPDVMIAPSTIEDLQRGIDGALAEWKGQAQAITPSVTVDVESQLGPAAEVILAWERAQNPYAIVMGTRGRGRIASAVLGSVSQRVLHDARSPVIVVRPEHGK